RRSILLIEQTEHLLNGLDSGDWLGRKREREGHCSEKLPIDVYRTAAHPGDHAGFCERTTGQSCKDHVLFGSIVLQYTKQLDIELLDSGSLKDGLSIA